MRDGKANLTDSVSKKDVMQVAALVEVLENRKKTS